MRKIEHLAIFGLSIFCTTVFSTDIDPTIFKNDKEVKSLSLKENMRTRVLKKYSDAEVKKLEQIFYISLGENLKSKYRKCNMTLFNSFINNLYIAQFDLSSKSVKEYISLLRATHKIDDIMYEHLIFANEQKSEFEEILSDDLDEPRKNVGVQVQDNYLEYMHNWSYISAYETEVVKQNDVNALFSKYKLKSDDSCLIDKYKNIFYSLKYKKEPSEGEYKAINIVAYYEGLIDKETYYLVDDVLETIRDNELPEVNFNHYINTLVKAKNTLVPVNFEADIQDIQKENDFTSKQLKRYSKLSRRKLLYLKYNSRQIIMLANVIKRASIRMGADPDVNVNKVSINFFYETVGERKNYVEEIILDPQSQYNLARRLMRKDIIDLASMDTFKGISITYEDMVMAALETGYITFEDIEYVVKYDDLWNKEVSKWQRFKDFAFSVGGTASLFLPPPLNVLGTIGLVVAESTVNKRNRDGANHVNPAAIID